jgi:tetratricopeptide (TPR) repeat protein
MDLASDMPTRLYFYNALLAENVLEPNSAPIAWLTGIMARDITKNAKSGDLTSETRTRILGAGVIGYHHLLELLGTNEGPYLLHQTLGNLYDDLDAYDHAAKSRGITLRKWRNPVSLHASACTLAGMFRFDEALAQINEALAVDPGKENCLQIQGDIFLGFSAFPKRSNLTTALRRFPRTTRPFFGRSVLVRLSSLGISKRRKLTWARRSRFFQITSPTRLLMPAWQLYWAIPMDRHA